VNHHWTGSLGSLGRSSCHSSSLVRHILATSIYSVVLPLRPLSGITSATTQWYHTCDYSDVSPIQPLSGITRPNTRWYHLFFLTLGNMSSVDATITIAPRAVQPTSASIILTTVTNAVGPSKTDTSTSVLAINAPPQPSLSSSNLKLIACTSAIGKNIRAVRFMPMTLHSESCWVTYRSCIQRFQRI